MAARRGDGAGKPPMVVGVVVAGTFESTRTMPQDAEAVVLVASVELRAAASAATSAARTTRRTSSESRAP